MMKKQHWLFKSEPDCWSWQQQYSKAPQAEEWSGVRNYLARNNMKKMQLGDLGFFYHSNKQKAILGVVEICALAHQDSTTIDPRWQCVDVKALYELPIPISLSQIKAQPELGNMQLIKYSRLSVSWVSEAEWLFIHKMAGL